MKTGTYIGLDPIIESRTLGRLQALLQFAKWQLSPLTPILPGRIKPQPVQPEHRCFQDDDVEFISKLQFKAKHKGNLNE